MSCRRTWSPARLTIAGRCAVGLVVLASAACSGDGPRTAARDTVRAAEPRAGAVDLDSVARVQRAESLATVEGRWNASEVISRLEAAGLVVRDLERSVRAEGFSVGGRTLAVSGGELVIFLYPDAASRAADSGALDSSAAAPPGTSASWPSTPRLITSGNLAAVLLTDREQLAERVRNVLAARHGG